MLAHLHKQLLNNFQRDFPLTPRPYLAIAEKLNVSEAEVIDALIDLQNHDLISRIGPIIPPNRIGKSTLIAMTVPSEQLAAVAEIINTYPEVNHNYEREHRFNLWFVLISSNDKNLQSVISSIEHKTGFKTMQLPLLEEFYINLGFTLKLDHD